MAKIVKMNAKNMKTFIRPGNDESNDWIRAFILGKEFIERRGLKIRNVLKDFMLELLSIFGSHVTTDTLTTKISSQFHLSRM